VAKTEKIGLIYTRGCAGSIPYSKESFVVTVTEKIYYCDNKDKCNNAELIKKPWFIYGILTTISIIFNYGF